MGTSKCLRKAGSGKGSQGEGHLQHHDVTYDPEELLSSGGTMGLSLPWEPIFSLSHHLLRPSGGHLQAEFGVQVLECPSNEGLTDIWGLHWRVSQTLGLNQTGGSRA